MSSSHNHLQFPAPVTRALHAGSILLSALALTHAPAGEQPPLEFTLHIDGAPQPIVLGMETEIVVGDKTVKAVLSATPYRVFNRHGVRFAYPKDHAWEEEIEAGISMWTLDGTDNVLMVQRFGKTDSKLLAGQVANAMAAQYGEKNVKRSSCQMTFAGRERTGIRLDVNIAGVALQQELYHFTTTGGSWILIVQDSLTDDGAMSANTTETRKYLGKSLQIENEEGAARPPVSGATPTDGAE